MDASGPRDGGCVRIVEGEEEESTEGETGLAEGGTGGIEGVGAGEDIVPTSDLGGGLRVAYGW